MKRCAGPQAAITNGEQATLTFTLTNPAGNTVPLTGVSFTDALPAGLGVPAAAVGTCGGTLRTSAPGTIAWTAATIAVGGTCTFSVAVIDVAAGVFVNTTGNVEREKIVLAAMPELSLQIVEFARGHGRVTIGEVIKLTGASRNTLKQHFRTLVARPTLNQHGSGRGVWYHLR